MSPSSARSGLLYAIGAYGLWGVFPVYWKLLQDVPAMQLLAHRVVWAFTEAHAVTFGCIWTAVLLYTADTVGILAGASGWLRARLRG